MLYINVKPLFVSVIHIVSAAEVNMDPLGMKTLTMLLLRNITGVFVINRM